MPSGSTTSTSNQCSQSFMKGVYALDSSIAGRGRIQRAKAPGGRGRSCRRLEFPRPGEGVLAGPCRGISFMRRKLVLPSFRGPRFGRFRVSGGPRVTLFAYLTSSGTSVPTSRQDKGARCSPAGFVSRRKRCAASGVLQAMLSCSPSRSIRETPGLRERRGAFRSITDAYPELRKSPTGCSTRSSAWRVCVRRGEEDRNPGEHNPNRLYERVGDQAD